MILDGHRRGDSSRSANGRDSSTRGHAARCRTGKTNSGHPGSRTAALMTHACAPMYSAL